MCECCGAEDPADCEYVGDYYPPIAYMDAKDFLPTCWYCWEYVTPEARDPDDLLEAEPDDDALHARCAALKARGYTMDWRVKPLRPNDPTCDRVHLPVGRLVGYVRAGGDWGLCPNHVTPDEARQGGLEPVREWDDRRDLYCWICRAPI